MSKQDGQEAVVKVDVPGTSHYGAVVLNLRDHFAAQVITGLLASDAHPGVHLYSLMDNDSKILQRARFAYAIADAMLAARPAPHQEQP